MHKPKPAAETQTQNDAVSRGIWWALDTVCDTSVLLILEACWLGDRSFTQICKSTGLQKALVSNRLTFLQDEGIIKKLLPSDGGKRHLYLLTRRGLALLPVSVLMLAWEQRWSQQKNAPLVKMVHINCGQEIIPDTQCQSCGDRITLADLSIAEPELLFAGQTSFLRRRRQAGLDRENIHVFHEISEILGDRWTTLILRQAFLGDKRFDDFVKSLGIASNILNDRLARGLDNGLFTKQAYQHNPQRYEYILSAKAMDILPMILMIGKWGIEQKVPSGQRFQHIRHICGAVLNPVVVCSHCGEEITIESTRLITET